MVILYPIILMFEASKHSINSTLFSSGGFAPITALFFGSFLKPNDIFDSIAIIETRSCSVFVKQELNEEISLATF